MVREYENQEIDEEEMPVEQDDEEDESPLEFVGGDDNGDDDDDEDDGMENGLEEVDPQVLKLQERIKFLRHRCVSSLGN